MSGCAWVVPVVGGSGIVRFECVVGVSGVADCGKGGDVIFQNCYLCNLRWWAG